MHTEDGYIIHKCLEGDKSAFGFLVDKYKGSVYAQAYSRLRNFHDAEDVAQEAFIIAYRKLHTLRRWDSVMAWLYSITSNLCKLRIRSQSRRPDSEFIEDQDQGTLDQPSIDHYQDSSVIESINDALNSLPDAHREILSLHYLAGMKVMDMAKYLGMSPRTISSRLKDARSRLKKEVLEMMNTRFEEQRLGAGFTIRIVEMVKNIRISPLSQTKVPWGLSLATGIVLAILGISANINQDNVYQSISSAIGESKVMNIGEFPVDLIRTSDIPVITNADLDGDGSGNTEPSLQNALFMSPQAEGGTWTKKADMPTARECTSASEVNGKIYLIGGSFRNANGWLQDLNTVEEYDPLTDKWTRKSAIPTARSVFSTSVVDGKIYAIGGSTAFGISSIVEEYDPIADKWARKANMPTARSGLSTCAVNGKIYAIGGSRWDNVNAKLDIFSIVEEYDPKADRWTVKADMPTKRGFFTSSASAVDGLIYVIGGGDGKGAMFSIVEQYDPIADKWERKTDMPTARVTCTAMVNGKIYAIGGYEGKNRAILSIVEEYDPVSDRWTRKNDMPTARTTLSVCAVNGKIYAMGGNTDVQKEILVSVVEEYDPQAESKNIDFKGKLPTTWGDTKLAQNR